jgi:hypothetical protein
MSKGRTEPSIPPQEGCGSRRRPASTCWWVQVEVRTKPQTTAVPHTRSFFDYITSRDESLRGVRQPIEMCIAIFDSERLCDLRVVVRRCSQSWPPKMSSVVHGGGGVGSIVPRRSTPPGGDARWPELAV